MATTTNARSDIRRGRAAPATTSAFTLAVLMIVATACGAKPPPDVVAFSVDVTGSTGQEFQDEAAAELARVSDAAVDKGARLVVLQWAGTPKDVKKVFSEDLRVGGSGSLQTDVAKQRKRDATRQALAQLPPPAGVAVGTDVFGSLYAVGQLVNGTARDGAARVLVARTDGENISELVDLRKEELATPGRIEAILDTVDRAGLLPNFRGTDTSVYIVGVGRGGEAARSSVRARQYQALYTAWCDRTGAAHCTVDSQLNAFVVGTGR